MLIAFTLQSVVPRFHVDWVDVESYRQFFRFPIRVQTRIPCRIPCRVYGSIASPDIFNPADDYRFRKFFVILTGLTIDPSGYCNRQKFLVDLCSKVSGLMPEPMGVNLRTTFRNSELNHSGVFQQPSFEPVEGTFWIYIIFLSTPGRCGLKVWVPSVRNRQLDGNM